MAKQLIYTGSVIKSDEALRIGLVNAVYPQAELMNQAMSLATAIAKNAPIAVAKAKECINKEYDMEAREAISYENTKFGECFNTTDQKNGMAAFLNKEKFTLKENKHNCITKTFIDMKICVIGTGTMGSGVVQAFAQAGMPVVMKSRSQASLDKAMARISKGLARLVEKGKMEQSAMDQVIANITPTTDYAQFADADLVIEAAVEEMSLKKTFC